MNDVGYWTAGISEGTEYFWEATSSTQRSAINSNFVSNSFSNNGLCMSIKRQDDVIWGQLAR